MFYFGSFPMGFYCNLLLFVGVQNAAHRHCGTLRAQREREKDWAAMDLKTLLSGQEGPGIDASAILIRHQRRLTAERRS